MAKRGPVRAHAIREAHIEILERVVEEAQRRKMTFMQASREAFEAWLKIPSQVPDDETPAGARPTEARTDRLPP